MYRCKDCGLKFKTAAVIREEHFLDSPPYESIPRCPKCGSASFEEIKIYYCRCCGARMFKEREYCSAECAGRARQLQKMKHDREQFYANNPLFVAVREVEKYNRENGTRLSYGQYTATVGRGKG